MSTRTWLLHTSIVAALGMVGCGEFGGDGTGGDGGVVEAAVACDDATPCSQGNYCDYADDLCGAGDSKGECREIASTGCDAPTTVCTCDGVAESCPDAAGADLTAASTCDAPFGTFPCASFFCEISTAYCASQFDGVSCGDGWFCAPLPTECTDAPSCACLADIDYTFNCQGQPSTGFTAALPGGHGPDCP